MEDNKDNIMIALLPITTDWSKLELPHLTLVYSGKVGDHKPTDFNTMAKDAASLAMISRPITLSVMGVEPMGPPDDVVAALILRPNPQLMAMRNFLLKWDRSKWPTYRPHATIGQYPAPLSFQPSTLTFNKIMVCYGEEHLTFWLDRS